MHKFTLPQAEIDRSIANRGVPHPFGTLNAAKTALVVIDMQNYFVAPRAQGEIPMAREIVPSINRLAQAMRAARSHVIWVQNSTNGTRESWSVLANHLMTPARAAHRWAAMDEGAEGFKLWPALNAKPEDWLPAGKRMDFFIWWYPETANLRHPCIQRSVTAGVTCAEFCNEPICVIFVTL
jgi:ureidoacrylate peracid hydrolase